jgi:hypothetical protein
VPKSPTNVLHKPNLRATNAQEFAIAWLFTAIKRGKCLVDAIFAAHFFGLQIKQIYYAQRPFVLTHSAKNILHDQCLTLKIRTQKKT